MNSLDIAACDACTCTIRIPAVPKDRGQNFWGKEDNVRSRRGEDVGGFRVQACARRRGLWEVATLTLEPNYR